MGASSILHITPTQSTAPNAANSTAAPTPPKGVVVAVLCNMQGVGFTRLAEDVARQFSGLKTDAPFKVQKVYQC